MRLKVPRVTAEEYLTALLNKGYSLLNQLWSDYTELHRSGTFEADRDMPRYDALSRDWLQEVVATLEEIFPTPLEANFFGQRHSFGEVDHFGIDQRFGRLAYQILPERIDRLRRVLDNDLPRYTDLPLKDRLFVEDIDSFRKVRDINPAMVRHALDDGYLAGLYPFWTEGKAG